MSQAFDDANLHKIWSYYDRGESRIGYRYILGGTKHFGFYGPGQTRWAFTAAMRRMEDRLGAELALPAGSKVLDAGCGIGNVARAMADRHGLDVTGIDILDFNIAEANRRSAKAGLTKATRFHIGDYHHLPFPDSSFDGLYTMETFVHSADPKAALAEFKRVLKPGGKLVMFEYSRTRDSEVSPEANRAMRRVCDEAAMPAWLELYHGVLDEMLGAAGFAVESSVDITANMMPMASAFYLIGKFPFWVGRITRLEYKVVNAMSARMMFRYKEAWHYGIHTAVNTD
ncbi:methyltransferase domain-containing protein [Catenulispora subtropica]|uniref:Methyltransferase type 11 domain-containing protein n=1 Tax=Catenulispora subtropica TaxID=450798 RepID=A0ABP5EDR7_9ACTN